MDGNGSVDGDNKDLFKTSLWGCIFSKELRSILYQHWQSGETHFGKLFYPQANHETVFANKGW